MDRRQPNSTTPDHLGQSRAIRCALDIDPKVAPGLDRRSAAIARSRGRPGCRGSRRSFFRLPSRRNSSEPRSGGGRSDIVRLGTRPLSRPELAAPPELLRLLSVRSGLACMVASKAAGCSAPASALERAIKTRADARAKSLHAVLAGPPSPRPAQLDLGLFLVGLGRATSRLP